MDVICPEFKTLGALVDGEETTPEVRAHVASCPRCQKAVRSLRSLDALLAPEHDIDPPAELEARLRAIPDLTPARIMPARRRYAAAAAAVVLLAAGTWSILAQPGTVPDIQGQPQVVSRNTALRDRVADALLTEHPEQTALLTDLDGARMVILNRIAVEDDPDAARAALCVLAESAPRKSLPAALEAAEQPDRTREAILLLAAIGHRRALPILKQLLTETEHTPEVIAALVAIGGEEAARILDQSLDALSSPALREATVTALARADGLSGMRLLLARYRQPEFSTAVLAATEAHAGTLLPHLLLLAKRGEEPAFELLAELARPEAVPGLIPLLASRATRGSAARVLARIDTAPAADALIGRSHFPEVQLAFREAGAATENRLIALLETGQSSEKLRAVELLALCGGPRAVNALLPLARNRALTPAILESIGEIGGSEAVAALDLLAEIPRLARGAIRALGATMTEEAVPVLIRLGRDNRALRGEAVAALGRIPTPGAVRGILALEPDRRPRSATVRALKSMDRRVVVPALSSMLTGDLGPAARQALHALGDGPSSPRFAGNH